MISKEKKLHVIRFGVRYLINFVINNKLVNIICIFV